MALISESLKRSSASETTAPRSQSHILNMGSEGLESTGFTSQDAILSETRDQL